MSREGVPPISGECKKYICAIKEKLDLLWDRTQNAYAKLNGVSPDGTQDLKITAGQGVTVDTVSGNEVIISTDGSAGGDYTGIAPIIIDNENREIQIDIDGTPVIGSEQAITSGGVYAALSQEATDRANADSTLSSRINNEESARTAADTALGNRIDTVASNLSAETSARTAADTAESGARIAADNALGDRIDKLVDGTTPIAQATSAGSVPASGVTGVLDVQHGGTGSSTANRLISQSTKLRWVTWINGVQFDGGYTIEGDWVHIVGCIYLSDASNTSNAILNTSRLNQILNGSAIISQYAETYGAWLPLDSEDVTYTGYGTTIGKDGPDNFILARIYNSGGNIGGWQINNISNMSRSYYINFKVEI